MFLCWGCSCPYLFACLACLCGLHGYVFICFAYLLRSKYFTWLRAFLLGIPVCLICYNFKKEKFRKFLHRKICIGKLNMFFYLYPFYRYQFNIYYSYYIINTISRDVFRELQICRMELYGKKLITLLKSSIFDICKGSECADNKITN